LNKDEEFIKNAQTVQKIKEKERELQLKKKKQQVIENNFLTYRMK
jgi:hypothetical protein